MTPSSAFGRALWLLSMLGVISFASACAAIGGSSAIGVPVDAGGGASVRLDDVGFELFAGPGSFEPGSIEFEVLGAPPDAELRSVDSLITGPIIDVRPPAQPFGWVEIRFDVGPENHDALIVEFDEVSGWWLPVETIYQDGQLIGQVNHFSIKSWVDDRAEDVAGAATWTLYAVSYVAGNREFPPECDVWPLWLRNPDHLEGDPNRQLFWCPEETEDGLLAVRLVNNRSYPVTVAFDYPFARDPVRETSTDWGDALLRYATLTAPDSGAEVYLAGRESVTVFFAQPAAGRSAVQGFVQTDWRTQGAQFVREFASAAGGDPVALDAARCVAEGLSVGATVLDEASESDRATVEASNYAFDCIESVFAVTAETAATKAARRWLLARKVIGLGLSAIDATILDGFGNSESRLVDVALLLEGPDFAPQPLPTSTTAAPVPRISSEPGSEFASVCSIAWPTAPVVYDNGVQMTMQCNNLPLGFDFASVFVPDPNYDFYQAVGNVQVVGVVVNTADSQLGTRALVVEATSIGQ